MTASRFPAVDMESRYRRRQAVQNIASVYNSADAKTRAEGRMWYQRVNEMTSKDVRGTSLSERQGAGIVAAVSPNMDWENSNSSAVRDLNRLNSSQWKDIAKGDNSALKGTQVSSAYTSGLIKAKRIMDGEDPDEVLSRRTAPKTNSFFHNIAEPDVNGPVTIDGRAHDIAANRLQTWESNRGIGSAALKTGKKTRYEHFEDSYRSAAHALSEQHGEHLLPHEVQAVTWERGKQIERSVPTKSGAPRKFGVKREGQPYLGPRGLLREP